MCGECFYDESFVERRRFPFIFCAADHKRSKQDQHVKYIYLVAGARPNFMKIAPIVRAMRAHGGLDFKIIHTGQHYDRDMNEVFFEELGIPEPDVFMAAGGGSHSQQTGRIMVAFEELCQTDRPDAVLVVGDVNSTLACAIVAKKLSIPVAHVEAGLRSGDRTMPEEINRLVTDSISDLFFVTEPSGVAHLKREGKDDSAIHYVGHVMIDNLLYQVEKLAGIDTAQFGTNCFKAANRVNSKSGSGRYGVVTLHRPGNVDSAEIMMRVGRALTEIATELPLIFPVHPRTRNNLEKFGIDLGPNITLVGPQAYMPFLNLWKDAAVVLTDSGGLQEETTALGVPCITIRDNTERPVTVAEGSNVLAGTEPTRIVAEVRKVLRGEGKQGCRPHLWDGKAAERIVEILAREFASNS
ncbi:UDP-N-acetylglucosamine 2-epimerase (non-hydrolysing) [Nitrosovibrio sp. Nv4]|nr:UDP-N-acetylglucosamine 2-epimerase (non-hydrolysing) [Nitrosovibrio sp. Nv4]